MTVRARSLRTRLLWGTLLIIAVVMTAVMLFVEHRQRTDAGHTEWRDSAAIQGRDGEPGRGQSA